MYHCQLVFLLGPVKKTATLCCSTFRLEARLPLPCFPLMRLQCFIFQRKKRKSAAEVIGSDGFLSRN